MKEIAAQLRMIADRLDAKPVSMAPMVPTLAVGDLVECLNVDGWNKPSLIGRIGVVRTSSAARCDERYGVEWAGWEEGHDLNRTITTRSGYYLERQCLKKCNP